VSKSPLQRRLFALPLICAALVMAAWGCDKGDQHDHDHVEQVKQSGPPVYHVPKELDRDLNALETDSLRSMKNTHKITRDEYWDDHGGVLANDLLEVWYPDGKVNVMQGAAMFKHAMQSHDRVKRLFGEAPDDHLVIICAGNLEVYTYSTGRQWWHYSSIRGDTISIQAPIELYTRGLLKVVGPREYYEWAIGKISGGKAPRWVQEGFASYLAAEAQVLEDQRQDFVALGPVAIAPAETERLLKAEADRRETRRAYYNAYRMSEQLVKRHGETAVAAWVVAMRTEPDLNAASEKALAMNYDAVLAEAATWSQGEQ
jgi:hypothetical protein